MKHSYSIPTIVCFPVSFFHRYWSIRYKVSWYSTANTPYLLYLFLLRTTEKNCFSLYASLLLLLHFEQLSWTAYTHSDLVHRSQWNLLLTSIRIHCGICIISSCWRKFILRNSKWMDTWFLQDQLKLFEILYKIFKSSFTQARQNWKQS